jgi:RNA 3'-terminal phosphate cyclase
VSAEDTGRKAAHELLEAIESGGCVDKYIQVGSAPFVKK